MAAVATNLPFGPEALQRSPSFGTALLHNGLFGTSGAVGDSLKLGLNGLKFVEMAGCDTLVGAREVFAGLDNATTALGIVPGAISIVKNAKDGNVFALIQSVGGEVYMVAQTALAYANLSSEMAQIATTASVFGGATSQAIGAGRQIHVLCQGSRAPAKGITFSASAPTDVAAGEYKTDHSAVKMQKDSAAAQRKDGKTAAFFNLVKHISKLALGVFAGLALFYSFVLPSVVGLSISTLATLAAIFGSTFAAKAAVHKSNGDMIDRVMLAAKTA